MIMNTIAKRLLPLLLALMMCVTLWACNETPDTDPVTPDTDSGNEEPDDGEVEVGDADVSKDAYADDIYSGVAPEVVG